MARKLAVAIWYLMMGRGTPLEEIDALLEIKVNKVIGQIGDPVLKQLGPNPQSLAPGRPSEPQERQSLSTEPKQKERSGCTPAEPYPLSRSRKLHRSKWEKQNYEIRTTSLMGRKRTQTQLTDRECADVGRAVRSVKDKRERERLRFAIQASRGVYTLEDPARMARRSRSTIQNWLAKYTGGGLDGLLERHAPKGLKSPLSLPRVQRDLVDGLKAGRWASAAQVAAWLKETHGIRRSRKSIYYWFEKLGMSPLPACAHARIAESE